MLSYDWIKILAIAAVAIVLWSLIFTTSATRATIGQTFYLYSFYDVSMKNENDLEYLQEHNALSYDILDLSTYGFTDNSYLSQIMTSYFSACQGDVLFITDIKPAAEEDEETSEDTNEEEKPSQTLKDALNAYSNLQSFASAYYSILAPLGSDLTDENGKVIKENYFTACESYLDKFYSGDFRSGTLDEGAVKDNFNTRMKKDKRFKTETQKAAGLENEKIRIENLRTSYLNVQSALEKNIISIKATELVVADGKQEKDTITDDDWKTVYCSIDLSNISNITEYVTNTQQENSNEGLSLAIFDWSSKQYDLQFEPITYLDYLITTYHKVDLSA